MLPLGNNDDFSLQKLETKFDANSSYFNFVCATGEHSLLAIVFLLFPSLSFSTFFLTAFCFPEVLCILYFSDKNCWLLCSYCWSRQIWNSWCYTSVPWRLTAWSSCRPCISQFFSTYIQILKHLFQFFGCFMGIRDACVHCCVARKKKNKQNHCWNNCSCSLSCLLV